MAQYSTADILAKLTYGLSSAESDAVCRLTIAIKHAIECTHELPSTLNERERMHILIKLQEADHWCLELIRTTVA